MHTNLDLDAKKHANATGRYQKNAKIARILKWIVIILTIIPPAINGIINVFTITSWDAYYFYMDFIVNPPFLFRLVMACFFERVVVGIVLSVVMVVIEKRLKSKAKWHGDLGHYLHCHIKTGNSQELEDDIAEARKLRNYVQERHLQKIYEEIKVILRNAPK